MSIFVFAVIGFLIGAVATKTISGATRAGAIGDLGMAIAGSIAAGWVGQLPFGIDALNAAGLAASVAGGIILVGVERFAAGQRIAH